MSAVFPPVARNMLAALYPNRPGILAHGLRAHPLLSLDALADLAEALPADSIEYNPGDLPVGIDPGKVPRAACGIGEAIRQVATTGTWAVLKRIEQVPAYACLLHEVLAEIADVVRPRTGRMLGCEGFVFVSSPGSVTPFHFDPEHNILLQLAGTKTMTVFPGGAPLVSDEAHEAFHFGLHHRNLPWSEHFAAHGTALTIEPGEAIHVPVKTPHWVRNGPEPSISLSVTWRSEWSHAEADARAFNHTLRRFGLRPRPPRAWPAANLAKSLAWRALRRMRG